MREDHLELPVRHGFQGVGPEIEAEVFAGSLLCLSGQVREEVHAVDLAFRLLRPGQAGQGRQEIDAADQVVADPFPDMTGHVEDTGNPQTAVEGRGLAFPVTAGGAGMVAVIAPGPVVRRDDNEGILGDAQVLQRLTDRTDAPVQFHHDIAVEARPALAPEFVGDAEGHVRHGLGKVQEEGLVRLGLPGDIVHRPFRVHRGQLVHVVIGVDVPADFQAVVQRQARELHGRVVGPHVIGIGKPEPLVEAMVRRQEHLRVADVPFPEQGRAVAVCLHDFADSHRICILRNVIFVFEVARICCNRRFRQANLLRPAVKSRPRLIKPDVSVATDSKQLQVNRIFCDNPAVAFTFDFCIIILAVRKI